MRQLVPLFALALTLGSGCTDSHGRDDGGRDVDGGTDCDEDLRFSCEGVVGPHHCGDFFPSAECVGGVWQCPGGYVREGEGDCWCYGGVVGCECTPSGWSCLDAGVVGGCPADPIAAEGSACGEEGLRCGECTDPCGFCSFLRCETGVWVRYEAEPPPPPCRSFACGPSLSCDAATSYCSHAVSDVVGEPDSYYCQPYPSDCRSCDCLSGNACEGTEATGITVTWFGG